MVNYASIAMGGFLGAICRYLISNVLQPPASMFPAATLMVNWIGCLMLGFLLHLGWFERRFSVPVRTGITTGFLGSLTTFSTFSVELLEMLERGRLALVFVYIVLSLGGGYLLAKGGIESAIRFNRRRRNEYQERKRVP